MPEWFKEYLESLPEERKDQLHEWLEADESCCDEIADAVDTSA